MFVCETKDAQSSRQIPTDLNGSNAVFPFGRSKLTMFEGSYDSSNEREIHKGDRSSLGVLQELGLVRAMSQVLPSDIDRLVYRRYHK